MHLSAALRSTRPRRQALTAMSLAEVCFTSWRARLVSTKQPAQMSARATSHPLYQKGITTCHNQSILKSAAWDCPVRPQLPLLCCCTSGKWQVTKLCGSLYVHSDTGVPCYSEANDRQDFSLWIWEAVYLLPDGSGSVRRAPRDHSNNHNYAIDNAVDQPCAQVRGHSDTGGYQHAQHPEQADVAHTVLSQAFNTLQLQHTRNLLLNACRLTICIKGVPAPCLI